MKRALAAILILAASGIQADDKTTLDPIIESARKAAAEYTRSLPDYIAKRITSRYKGGRTFILSPTGQQMIVSDPHVTGFGIAWNLLNAVTADMVAVKGKEVYSNVLLDGRPVSNPESTGAWSSGEFSGILEGIFAPTSMAVFRSQRKETIAHRKALHYDFHIDHAHSGWNINGRDRLGPRNWAAAYSGEVWIDEETGQTLKVEMWALDLPPDFATDAVSLVNEYEFVKIADTSYLLPTHSEIISCARGQALCVKNETTFKNYDKFSADTAIHFQ